MAHDLNTVGCYKTIAIIIGLYNRHYVSLTSRLHVFKGRDGTHTGPDYKHIDKIFKFGFLLDLTKGCRFNTGSVVHVHA